MLEAALIVEPPCPWLRDAGPRQRAGVRMVGCRPSMQGSGAHALVEVMGRDATKFIRNLNRRVGVIGVHMNELKGGRLLASVLTDTCPCRKAGLTNLHIISMDTLENGTFVWKVLIPSRAALRGLLRRLKKAGVGVREVAMSSSHAADLLTRRQRAVLEIAFRMGYFDFPRKVSLTQLAKYLEISPSALMELLRRAERSVMRAAPAIWGRAAESSTSMHWLGRPTELARLRLAHEVA